MAPLQKNPHIGHHDYNNIGRGGGVFKVRRLVVL